jgi:ABC-type branched-subunit amino acid transport system permease subunit
MTMVVLGLNLIYGFNGQFSLGQWGFYAGVYVGRLRPTDSARGSQSPEVSG